MRRLIAPILLTMLFSVGLAGQRTARPFTMFGGLAVATGGYGLGIQAGASFTVPISSSVGIRLDAGFQHFRGGSTTDGAGYSSVDMLNGTASIAVLGPPYPKRRVAWIAGAGLYKFFSRGSVDVRPGLNVRARLPFTDVVSLAVGFHGVFGRKGIGGFFPAALELQL